MYGPPRACKGIEKLEGMRLRTLQWSLRPLAVDSVQSAFYARTRRDSRQVQLTSIAG
jgi:hypothetical protein